MAFQASARAISANATATNAGQPGYLTLFPGNGTQPLTSTINFLAGRTRANNVTLPLATDGTGTFRVFTGSPAPVDFILDVNGYFE